MSKTNVPAKVEKSEDQRIMIAGELTSLEQVTGRLKRMTPGIELSADYKEFETEGDTMLAYVVGLAKIPKKGNIKEGEDDKVPAIRLLADDGKLYISAEAVIVSTLYDVANSYQNPKDGEKPVLRAYEITFTEWAKSARGDYRKFSIKELN